MDKTTIFAQIEAFIQRCRDLLDLCECQMHFARWEEGVRTQLPIFGGQRGPSINRMLTEIETAFEKHLQELRKVQHTILNVKATTWHEDYNRFRSAVKDLEVMMTNVITYAFDAVRTVEQGVEVLDVYTHLNSREVGRRFPRENFFIERFSPRQFVEHWIKKPWNYTISSNMFFKPFNRLFPPRRFPIVSIVFILTLLVVHFGLEI